MARSYYILVVIACTVVYLWGSGNMSRVWDWIRYLKDRFIDAHHGNFDEDSKDGTDLVKAGCTTFLLQCVALAAAVQDYHPIKVIKSQGSAISLARVEAANATETYDDRLIITLVLFSLTSIAVCFLLFSASIIRRHREGEPPMFWRTYDRNDPYFYDKPTVYMARWFAYVFAIAAFIAVLLGYYRQIPGQVREVETPTVQPYTFNYDGGEGLIVVAKLRVEEVPQNENGKNVSVIRMIAEVPLSLLSSGWHIHTIRERDDNPVQPERIIPESPRNLQLNQRQLALRNPTGIQRGEVFVAVVYLKPRNGWISKDKDRDKPSSAEEVLEGFKSGLYSVTIQPAHN